MPQSTVIAALRRFLPAYREQAGLILRPTQRAIWALTHCRTAVLGGSRYHCADCAKTEFAYHSCNHRSCPQCGRAATAKWVQRELEKRVNAPYFMVTFTLPAELRPLFFGIGAKSAFDAFFAATSKALAEQLAQDKQLRAQHSGFTGVLHTWNQRLHFHPHIHYIVPGAGITADGTVVTAKKDDFLVYLPKLQQSFRWHFARELEALNRQCDPSVWTKDWGINIQPFGDGTNAIKYLGTYVCRSAIADSRIVSSNERTVTFRWKDRANDDRICTETVNGIEFVKRYLRHVLPKGLRAIRYYGFCHPAAKAKRERIAFHTGMDLHIGSDGASNTEDEEPSTTPTCPCCKRPMVRIDEIAPVSSLALGAAGKNRAPPEPESTQAVA